eukprot:TRINITY_DN10593_c0_g2_i1.p1 TRINITY_DN10593_c0_g2~~TRINITY_DN10593_c0_g2_i1.p1  ORF type:complete len:359 (-),score=38.12 TRINITY_DN10593_c0_g2_i1:166-1122(-)
MYQGIYHGKQAHDVDIDTVLDRAKAAGVEKILVTAGSLEESKQALDFVRNPKYSNFLFSTVGVHPTRCDEFESKREPAFGNEIEISELSQTNPSQISASEVEIPLCAQQHIEALADVIQQSNRSVRAVGECGLDYDRTQFCSKEVQLRYFPLQFELARRSELPMFLHDRNTGPDFANMVRMFRDYFSTGVVHSFTGTSEELHELLELDLYIGINGCSLKTQENLQVMAEIPLNRLMIETDAPWCDIRATHAGYRHVKTQFASEKKEKHKPASSSTVKNRNEPCHIRQVLEVIAGHRGIDDIEALAAQIYDNSIRVFGN